MNITTLTMMHTLFAVSCRRNLALTLSLLLLTSTLVIDVAMAVPREADNYNIDVTVGNAQRFLHQRQVEQQTLKLTRLMDHYGRDSKVEKRRTLNSIKALAAQRQLAQQALLKLDPMAAVRSTVPMSKRAAMPDDVLSLLAQKKQLQGQLFIVYQDYADSASHRLRYELMTKTGRIQLHLPQSIDTTQLQSGMTVKADGWLFNHQSESDQLGTLVLDDSQESIFTLAATEDVSNTDEPLSKSTSVNNTLGEQKVLVLMLNFQDSPNLQPWSKEDVQQMVFGRVNDYYQEASYGQTWLSGDVRGYYTLPLDTNCDYFGMDRYAQQLATDDGIDLSQYQRLVYLLPQNSSCGWRGQGTLGGNPSRAWINGELNLLTIGHELGHNLGLKHAKELSCGDGYLSDACVAITYGDTLDIMGKSEGHFNLFNKERLGWLTPEQGDVISADDDGNYLLSPYGSALDGQAKGLKVRRGSDAQTGEPLWYYLEYRQGTGFDSFLAGKAVTQGVLLHLNQSDEDIESSLLLDMTPKSGLRDLDDAALIVGQSYTDAAAGVTITTEWADKSGVSVNVSYAGQSCIQSAPSLSITPNESPWVEAGSKVDYRVNITNNDSVGCGDASFAISANVPSGWLSQDQSLYLAPGESAATSVSVTSATSASEGFYDIAISATNVANTQYSQVSKVSYVVEEPELACVLAAPSFILTLDSSEPLMAGTQVVYRGTLINRDNNACSASDYEIAANVPTGWTANHQRISLSPGEQRDVSIYVTSLPEASAGIYDFDISAQHVDEPLYRVTDSATYTVASPVAVCERAAPILTLISANDTEVVAGTQVSYGISVTNKDTEACDSSSFDLSAQLSSGWHSSQNQLLLAPGQTSQANIVVTSDLNSESGAYEVLLTASNSQDGRYVASYSTQYTVKPVANSAPIAVDDKVSMTSKNAVLIDVLANDSDAENELVIVSVTQGAKGSVEITSAGQVRYVPAKSFKSSDSFSYTISDGDTTATARVILSLSSSGGNGGNKGQGKK
ncbi:Ig-like domain-containing protein [Shewanella algidipiscicola]|uniref:Ig-like domain-containing protein n=1 Tax=Shewanella algidipiscicola TaxID=614070 RepID=UPI000D7858CC|nr:NEW3 domain-containing protein [Shewanella algidipiscicola]